MRLLQLSTLALGATFVAAATQLPLAGDGPPSDPYPDCFFSCSRAVSWTVRTRDQLRACVRKPTDAARRRCLCSPGPLIDDMRACLNANCTEQALLHVESLCSEETLGTDDESDSGARSIPGATSLAVAASLIAGLLMLVVL